MFYVIHATLKVRRGEFSTLVNVPMFYLNSKVQGITSVPHAIRVGTEMLREIAGPDLQHIHVHAEPSLED